MYICPSCQEEIPNRVKKRSEECPFCHTPWPPEEPEVPDEPEAPAKPAGWGDEFRPSAAATGAEGATIAAEPPKSKAWIGILVALLVVGGGAGLYFGVFAGGDEGDEAGEQKKGGVSEAEFTAMNRWYKKSRKIVYDYMANTCKEFHDVGYSFHSYLKPRRRNVTVRGQTEVVEDFVLELKPDPAGKAKGKLDIFECPRELARLEHEHPFVLEAKVWERRQVFGAVLKYADLKVKGKAAPYIKTREITSLAVQDPKGFSFPKLKESEDPGLKALATPHPFRMGPGAKHFEIANLKWDRIKPGRYLMGTWRLELKSKKLRQRIKDWALACVGMKRKFNALDRPKKEHNTHFAMVKSGRDVVRVLCNNLEKIAKSLEPWNEADINAATAQIENAKNTWKTGVYQKLLKTGKELGNVVHAKPLSPPEGGSTPAMAPDMAPPRKDEATP